MKQLLLIIIVLAISSILNAQKVFKFNSQECVELYRMVDQRGEFLVYLVYDQWEHKLSDTDIKCLKYLNKLNNDNKKKFADEIWSQSNIDPDPVECLRPYTVKDGKSLYRIKYLEKQPFLQDNS